MENPVNCEKSSFNLLFFLFIFNYFAREFSAAQIEFAEQKVNLSLRDELLRELTRDFISIMQFCDCSIGRQFRCLSRIEQWRMVKSEATSTVLNRYLVSMQWQICTINCRMMGDKKKSLVTMMIGLWAVKCQRNDMEKSVIEGFLWGNWKVHGCDYICNIVSRCIVTIQAIIMPWTSHFSCKRFIKNPWQTNL